MRSVCYGHRAIVRIANDHRVPLWTVSQGRNNGYGGASARVDGSVIVCLRGMNRVLEVNDEQAYAVVEPGVRFLDLRDHLLQGGHKLWASSPDLGWGSVIGNTLEYGRGYTAYGDHASTACGMEVVLANGDGGRRALRRRQPRSGSQQHPAGIAIEADRLRMEQAMADGEPVQPRAPTLH